MHGNNQGRRGKWRNPGNRKIVEIATSSGRCRSKGLKNTAPGIRIMLAAKVIIKYLNEVFR
jgi:hypothetical protein